MGINLGNDSVQPSEGVLPLIAPPNAGPRVSVERTNPVRRDSQTSISNKCSRTLVSERAHSAPI